MKVIFDRDAVMDLSHITNRHESSKAGLGDRFQTEVKDAIAKIAEYPRAFDIHENLHAIPMKNFPCHIFYSLKTGNILKPAVLAFRQNTEKVKKRGI